LIFITGKDQHLARAISLVAQVLSTNLSACTNYNQGGRRMTLRWR
jgi:hypothetical protein